jgi:glycerate kinase
MRPVMRVVMRVVIAPDSFKGSLSARDAARAIAAGWRLVRPDDELVERPMADGGEGTVAVIAAAHPDAIWRPVTVTGPDGRRVDAGWLLLADGTAVVELAAAAGLPQMATLDALGASTYGLGELLRAAASDPAVGRILVALGGSATTDGGTGALRALGGRFRNAAGDELADGGGPLSQLSTVDPATVAPPAGGVTCLVDVAVPLLGPRGAAAQFAPQKGATAGAVETLEAGLARLAAVLGGDPAQPGAGAAGGTGYGLTAGWGATLAPGAEQVAAVAGVPAALAGADLLITGEGRYDAQSTQGKVVGHLLSAAGSAGVPVHIVAGSIGAPLPDGVTGSADLTVLAGGVAAALADPARWLLEAGRRLASTAT